eukprot:SAG11_NODE_71_length_18338_cov_14.752974_5_plen_80_part_00
MVDVVMGALGSLGGHRGYAERWGCNDASWLKRRTGLRLPTTRPPDARLAGTHHRTIRQLGNDFATNQSDRLAITMYEVQ